MKPNPQVWFPDEQADRYEIGDVFTFQHGPVLPNVFAFEVLGVDAEGRATVTRTLDKPEYAQLRPMLDRWAEREKRARNDAPRRTAIDHSERGWGDLEDQW